MVWWPVHMKILFLGKPQNLARVEALKKRLGRRHDVRGWGLSRPGAIHIHGWRWACLAGLLRLLLPEAALVWTIETWPKDSKFMAKAALHQAVWAGVEIVATTRALQWRMLRESGMRARYIPDGYDVPTLTPISVRRFGLWKGRYTAAVVSTLTEIRWVKQEYAKIKTRKKLVVVSHASGGRAEYSLFAGAAAIILGNPDTPTASVLSAMESGRPVVAVAAPGLEEILGVTAVFISAGAEDELAGALASHRIQMRTQRRARAHFTWERIFAEYLPLYHGAAFIVPMDSARGILKTAPGW